ncbi:hypothetical protein [Priestia megaterium]|uniref:hypothetical protein n=1 Tax=Priestia megaterium TaxID=1404 RepID=UPI002EABF3CD|nr:hypothetical protein [Priestia megaterium]
MSLVHNFLIKLCTDNEFKEIFKDSPEKALNNEGIEREKWESLKKIDLDEVDLFSHSIMRRRTNRLFQAFSYSIKLIGEDKFKALLKEFHYSYPAKPYQYPAAFHEGKLFLQMIESSITEKKLPEIMVDTIKYELAVSYIDTKKSLVKLPSCASIEFEKLSLSGNIIIFESFYNIQKLIKGTVTDPYRIKKQEEKLFYIIFKHGHENKMLKINQEVKELLTEFEGKRNVGEYIKDFLKRKNQEIPENYIAKCLDLTKYLYTQGILISEKEEFDTLYLKDLLVP